MAESAPPVRTFHFFGLTVQSDVALPVERVSRQPVDLRIFRTPEPLPAGDVLLQMRLGTPDGMADYSVAREGARLILRFAPFAEFVLDAETIRYRLLSERGIDSLPWLLLGSVMGFWLDCAGWPVLHGAAIDVNGHAVVLLGRSGAGKSTLAASFFSGGHRILGDDHVALENSQAGILVRPALPWLKVNADSAAVAGVTHRDLPLLHPRIAKRRLDLPEISVSPGALPVSRVYVLARQRGERPSVAIEGLSPRAALVELVRQSFSPRSVQAAGLQAKRLALLADVVDDIGVWRLSHSGGMGHLEDVRRAIVSHAQSSRES